MPEEIRVLAVNPAYASLIIDGLKTIEVRSRPTNTKGRVAIYASTAKQETIEGVHGKDYNYWILPTGVIIGTVEIIASSWCNNDVEFELYKNEHLAPDKYYREGKTHFWHLRRPVKFSQPISYTPPKGAVVWSKTQLPEEYQ